MYKHRNMQQQSSVAQSVQNVVFVGYNKYWKMQSFLHYFYWNRGAIPLSIPFLRPDLKEQLADLALKDTKNVTNSGSKDPAFLSRGNVKDNSLAKLNPLTQTEFEQFDNKNLSKHPVQSINFGASSPRSDDSGDANTSFEKTIKPPKLAISQLGLVGEGGRVSNIDHLEETKVAFRHIDITEPHRNNFTSLSTKIAGENTKILVGSLQILENFIFP